MGRFSARPSLGAVEIGVFVVRAFIKLREWVATHKEMARKLAELEQKVGTHDEAIRQLIDAIRQLMATRSTAHSPATAEGAGCSAATHQFKSASPP